MSADYSGLTRNTWPGTWSPTSGHPIALDTELRGTLQYVSGAVGDRLTDITGQRLQEGMLVYVKAGYTAGAVTRANETYYQYKPLAVQVRDPATGAMPNSEANWTEFSVGGNGTTVGENLYTLANPSAVAFLRINADNSVSALTAADFRTAIGASQSATANTLVLRDSAGSFLATNGGFSGQIAITRAWDAGLFKGQLFLGGSTGNRIDWTTFGQAAPTTTTRSVGTKLNFYPGVSATNVDYALGLESDAMWLSVPSSTQAFKFYFGNTSLASVSSTAVTAPSFVKVNGTAAQFLKADGTVDSTAYQPLDADLTAIAALSPTLSNFIAGNGTTWVQLTPAQGRGALGGTVLGQNLFTLNNPNAVTYPRINADNTVSTLDATTYRTAIGAVGGSGTANTIAKFSGTSTLTDSLITETGAGVIVAGTLTANSVRLADGGFNEFLKADGSVDSTSYLSQDGGAMMGNIVFASSQIWPVWGISQGGTGAQTVSGARTNLGLGTAATLNAGSANGVATLDASGTIPLSQIPSSLQGTLQYIGTWNAAGNIPALTSSVGVQNQYYVVSVAGSTNLNGITNWVTGDWAIFNGSVWQKIDNTDAVTSVNGFTGSVVLTTSEVSEAGNLYFTDSRARGAVSSSALGLSYSLSTGVFSMTSGYSIPTTASQSNWDTAYADRNKWDGGATGVNATLARTSIGGTILGQNLFTLPNVTGVAFPRFNADNSVSALTAADFKTAIGVTNGTVTSVVGTGNVSGLTLTGNVTTSGNITLGGTLTVTPSNFANQTANTVLAAPNGAAGAPTFRALVAADIPTLNQNTTGTASNVTGIVALANGGTNATTAANARVNLGAFGGVTADLNTGSSDFAWVHTQTATTITNMDVLQGTGGTAYSRASTFEGQTNGPFGNQWYSILNMQHRGGSNVGGTDGQNWGTLLAFGLTANTTRAAFRTKSNSSFLAWRELVTTSIGAGTANNIPKFSGAGALTASSLTDNGTAITTNATITASSFIRSGGTSSQFLKADGSLDSSMFQPLDTDLTAIANLLPLADNFIVGNGSAWSQQTSTQVRSSLGLGSAALLTAGSANGVATLDGSGTIPLSQIPSSLQGGIAYQGTWDASTNTPTLTSSVGTNGHYYVVGTAGGTNLNGVVDWQIGDWAIFNGTVWQKIDNTDAVTSVNGLNGTVVLGTSNIAEGTNLYYTNARARASISSTATGLTYSNATGAFSLTANYTIPTTASQTNWDTAYTNRIASLTTTGNSGASTLTSNVLNIPTYTLAGLGGLPLSGGTMTGNITFNAAQPWPTFNQNTTGNAATATALQTARTINGVAFNGSANITVADATKLPLSGGTMTGDLFVSVAGSSTASPRTMGMSDFNTNLAARFQFGDRLNSIQAAHAGRMSMQSYWGIEIYGGRQNGTTPLGFTSGATTDASLLVGGTVVANPVLVAMGANGQTGDLQQWRNNAGTVLSYVTSAGVIGASEINSFNAGTTTTSAANIRLTNNNGNGGGLALFGGSYTTSGVKRAGGTYIYSNQGGGLTLNAEGGNSLYLATNSNTALTINGSQETTFNKKVFISGSTTNSSLQISGLELQGYSTTNVWVASNTYLNGTNHVTRVAGRGSQVQMVGGEILLRTSNVDVAAGGTVNFIDARLDGAGNLTTAGDIICGTNKIIRQNQNYTSSGPVLQVGDNNYGFSALNSILYFYSGTTGFVFRNNARNADIASIDNSGNIAAAGNININGGAAKRLDFASGSYAPPTTGSRSAGTKIVLWPDVAASRVDYAIGIDAGTMWSSVATTGDRFRWYAGTTVVATILGSGQFSAPNIDASQNLSYNGTLYASGPAEFGGYNYGNGRINMLPSSTGSTKFIDFWRADQGAQVGSISTNGSNTFYNNSSDYRLKYGVKPIENASERVMRLKPCTYRWKTDDTEGEGFIAHELQEEAPYAVTGKKDAVHEDGSVNAQQIDPSKIIALLTASLQEALARISELEARIGKTL